MGHSMRYVLGIDPGGTTGMVSTRWDKGHRLEIIKWWEIRDQFEVGHVVEEWLSTRREYNADEQIVMESYVSMQTPFYADANLACQPIGMVRWLAHEFSVPLTLQRPQARLSVPEARLKSESLWIRGGAGHARQALRHVMVFLNI